MTATAPAAFDYRTTPIPPLSEGGWDLLRMLTGHIADPAKKALADALISQAMHNATGQGGHVYQIYESHRAQGRLGELTPSPKQASDQ